MDDSLKRVFYIVGIVAAIYLTIAYVLPFIFKVLAFIMKALFYGAIGAAVILAVVVLAAYLIKRLKNNY